MRSDIALFGHRERRSRVAIQLDCFVASLLAMTEIKKGARESGRLGMDSRGERGASF
jgi:hypothetical protein